MPAGRPGNDARGDIVAIDSGEWIGLEVAEGRYHILARIGQGSMGRVYLAHDRHLDTDVVLKFPVAKDEAAAGPEFLDRFAREIRSLVRLSHPHVVRVIDAGDVEGRPFVVMQFLGGGSLKDRMVSGPGGGIQPMPPQSLKGWLLEIGKALDLTVHEVLCGRNSMEGPTPSATVVNQTMVVPPALTELIPGVPSRLSDAVLRGLSKDPDERFESCAALAREILEAVPTLLEPASRSSTSGLTPFVVESPDPEPEPDPSAATVLAERPGTAPAAPASRPSARATWHVGPLGVRRAAIGLLALALLASGGWLWSRRHRALPGAGEGDVSVPPVSSAAASAPVAPEPAGVEINIAYGTEKQRWFEAAAAEFQKTPAGRGITIGLHGMGSMEGARAVLEGPGPIPIQVWSPASSAYRDLFERKWRAKHGRAPILKGENLALTPMIFVMWESRREPFMKKYTKVRFQTLAQAMEEPGGWGTIAAHPEWGRFKFGHTHPNESNSGLIALVLMAYEYFQKEHNLSHGEIARPEFQRWLRGFERAVARPGGSLTHSSGTLMREMVLRGPSQYDCLVIYENLAIDYLEAAKDRWGPLVVDYPEPNMWNEHPYYILDVPWSDSRQRMAAGEFLKFLMSEPIQRRALDHGFRPGNPAVSLRFPESPLIRHAGRGIRIDLPRMCEPPRDDVVQDLLAASRGIEE
jgi:hypothetical protein